MFFDFFARFTGGLFRLAHIFCISSCSKFESFHKPSYFETSCVLCLFWECTFIKYFQIAGSSFGQSGQWIGTFGQGEGDEGSSATWYGYFTLIKHLFYLFYSFLLIFRLPCTPCPFLGKNQHRGDGQRHNPHTGPESNKI